MCRKPKPNAKRAIKNSHKQADNKQNALANTGREREGRKRGGEREEERGGRERKRGEESVRESGEEWVLVAQPEGRQTRVLFGVCVSP